MNPLAGYCCYCQWFGEATSCGSYDKRSICSGFYRDACLIIILEAGFARVGVDEFTCESKITSMPDEYQWMPSICSHCNVFGHSTSTCPKFLGHDKVVEAEAVVLKSRSSQWRPKGKEGPSGSRQDKDSCETRGNPPPPTSIVAIANSASNAFPQLASVKEVLVAS